MQPKTLQRLNGDAFERIKDEMRTTLSIARAIDEQPTYATPLPQEVGFQLTNRCNLRCSTCFQWSDNGFHNSFSRDLQRAELDLQIVRRVLHETRSIRSTVYLWGGEPLLYRNWDQLATLLAADRRRVLLCTNGLELPSKISTILPISKDFVCLVSMDGFEAENDALRGKHTFRRAFQAIMQVLELKRSGQYLGEVAISCVLNAPLIPRLVEFVDYFDQMGVDSVYLVFPWYIPKTTANKMDQYFETNFSWLRDHNPEFVPNRANSWHSYDFFIAPELVDNLRQQMRNILDRVWRTRVRFQPELDLDEVREFVLGSEKPAQRRTRCLSVARRLNVMPDGGVTTCKLFPEFRVGTLNDRSVAEIWHSVIAAQTRSKLADSLTPVCSKCVQLYLHSP